MRGWIPALVLLTAVAAAALAPLIAPHDPFDLAGLDLMDSLKPPAFATDGDRAYPLGTDDQGRDILSAILYGARISLAVGGTAMLLAVVVGVAVGLAAGYLGGLGGAALMRLADVQLTFPAILVALLVDGVIRAALPRLAQQGGAELLVLVVAIGASRWPQFARIVRAGVLVERGRDYVAAARVIGISAPRIALTHILPNVLGPVLVVGTLNVGLAILDEATLSFLGVGLPPTQPSLGTLIRNGNNFLFSGAWWIAIFPGLALVGVVLAINLLGERLRHTLDPRAR